MSGTPATPREAHAGPLSPVAYLAPASLYLHIPFCLAKCSYCDFASYPLDATWYAPYVAALVGEVSAVGSAWEHPQLETVYIGGGTPTVLPTDLLTTLLETIRLAFRLSPDAEVTVESNPGTVTWESLSTLRAAGVNRLSFGIQSFQPAFLRLLGRIHSAEQAIEAVRVARRAGMDNLSLDLIYGLPGQSLQEWQVDLDMALTLAPEHLSLYALTLEDGTRLAARVSCGEVPPPDADLAAEMYEESASRLAAAGYVHYEISNWARKRTGGNAKGREGRHKDGDWRCRHNLTYWLNRPYIGCGAAAHSWLCGQRRANVRHPREYIDCLRQGQEPVAEMEAISPELERAETMILGLRLLEGVSRDDFRSRFGTDPEQLYAGIIAESRSLGLLECDETHIRLTARGLLLSNQVLWRFLPE